MVSVAVLHGSVTVLAVKHILHRLNMYLHPSKSSVSLSWVHLPALFSIVKIVTTVSSLAVVTWSLHLIICPPRSIGSPAGTPTTYCIPETEEVCDARQKLSVNREEATGQPHEEKVNEEKEYGNNNCNTEASKMGINRTVFLRRKILVLTVIKRHI